MTTAEETTAQPFVKWVGGKRQVLPQILPRIPAEWKDYWEAFLGGGAMFYALHAEGGEHKYNLSDINSELINTYTQIKKNPAGLLKLLKEHDSRHQVAPPFYKDGKDWKSYPQADVWYYQVRSGAYVGRSKVFSSADSKLRDAARFIYMNRTCFNGLHRVNSKGEFNVPAGRYTNPEIIQAERIAACSKAFKQASFRDGGYADIESKVKAGDFVYLDPPYDVWDATSFTGYASEGFGWDDQLQLAQFADRLKKKGVHVMLSNHATERILETYKKLGFHAHCFGVKRSVAASAASRGAVGEVLLMSYPQKLQRDPAASRDKLILP